MQISGNALFIGSGNMACAIMDGILKAQIIKPQNIFCNDIDEKKLADLSKRLGIIPFLDKKESLKEADIVFLSVKPQNIVSVLDEIKPFIKKGALIISIIAAIQTKFIEDSLNAGIEVVRVMPNTASLLLCGVSAICGGRYASKESVEKVKNLFSCIGKAEIMDENHFDAITALSGSGVAYIFYFCELMQKAGEKLGLKEEIAKRFALQTVYGAGKMLVESGLDAELLRKNVTSPNGTTEAAIKSFQDSKLEDIVFQAMQKARDRSIELSN